MGWLSDIRAEWPVIKAAPWSVAALIVMSLSVGGSVMRLLDGHQIADAIADRDLAQHQVGEARKDARAPPPQIAALFSTQPAPPSAQRKKLSAPGHVAPPPVSGNDNVVSNNQSGGITARTVNVGPQPRALSDELR